MTPEHEERIYSTVLQRVIYGDDRKEILEMLATSGIVGGEAEEMLDRAHKERNAALRGEAVGKVIKGALLLGAGVGLFFLVRHEGDVPSRLLRFHLDGRIRVLAPGERNFRSVISFDGEGVDGAGFVGGVARPQGADGTKAKEGVLNRRARRKRRGGRSLNRRLHNRAERQVFRRKPAG